MINTVEKLNEVRGNAIADLNRYACRVLVCSGTGCIATGSNKIHEIFEDIVKEAPGVELVFSPCGGHDDEKVVGVKKTGCQGFCELGPLVTEAGRMSRRVISIIVRASMPTTLR